RGRAPGNLRRRDHRDVTPLRARAQIGELMTTSPFLISDPRFAKFRILNTHLEQLWTGGRWLEGPAYFAAGRYLVFSDIPNNRMMRWDETDGSVSVFRQPSHNANGNTVDGEGRLVSCEHQSRAITRTEHD